MAQLRTNNLFQLYTLRLYDYLFQKLILMDCPCYKVYECSCSDAVPAPSCEFHKYLFVDRNNYFACVKLPDTVAHKKFPIMFGSTIDLQIRKKHLSDGDVCLFGSIYTQSGCKLITNFLTNNLINGFSYQERKKGEEPRHVYRMNISDDQFTMQLKYLHSKDFQADIVDDVDVAIRRKQQQFLNKKEFVREIESLEEVFEFIQKCAIHKFDRKYVEGVTLKDYEGYMLSMIADPIPLDSLLNKTVLTGPVILRRMYDSCVASAEIGTSCIAASMGSLFTTGNGYHVLTKKKHIKVSSEFSQSIYVPIDGEKFDQIGQNLSVIKRYTNTQTQMSKALQYPVDAQGYLCLLTIKEMVNAGQTIYFASSCISSPPIASATLFEAINAILNDSNYQKESEGLEHRRLVIESFLTNLVVSTEFPRWLKKRCTFAFVREVDDRYYNIQHSGNIIMKWSSRYELFLATNEIQFFPNAFENMHPMQHLSWFSYQLAYNFWQTMPAKLTVSIANIRGSLCVISNVLVGKLFLYNVGYNSAMLHQTVGASSGTTVTVSFHEEPPLKVLCDVDKLMYLKLAILEHEPRKPQTQIDWSKQPKGYLTGSSISNVWKEKDVIKIQQVFDEYLQLVFWGTVKKDLGCSLGTLDPKYKNSSGNITIRNSKLDRVGVDCLKRHENQLYIWVAFGDCKGGTNEDGIVLDSSFCKNGPIHINAATFKVVFSGGPKGDTRIYTPINKQFGDHIIFGVLVTKSKLSKSCSKNVTVHQVKIKDVYQYWLFIVDQVDCHKEVASYYKDNTVSIHYRYLRRMGVGTKISWVHGQKNVVSLVQDLSHMKFYTREGICVHPQMLAPPAGVLGRSPVGQFVDNVTSPLLAFNEYGMYVAPLAINIHHIDPGVRMRRNNPKVCLMTQDNGFLGNDLSEVMGVLEQQASDNIRPRFDLLCELAKTHHVKFDFMSVDWLKACQQIKMELGAGLKK